MSITTLTEQQVVQELRRIRYGRPPSLSSIAKAAGISRVTLYEVINTGAATERLTASLSMALQNVRSDGV